MLAESLAVWVARYFSWRRFGTGWITSEAPASNRQVQRAECVTEGFEARRASRGTDDIRGALVKELVARG
jgi:hypothetical protein